jgi:hypothetical protein
LLSRPESNCRKYCLPGVQYFLKKGIGRGKVPPDAFFLGLQAAVLPGIMAQGVFFWVHGGPQARRTLFPEGQGAPFAERSRSAAKQTSITFAKFV